MTQAIMGSIPWGQVHNATDNGILESLLERHQSNIFAMWQVIQRSMQWLVAITIGLNAFSMAAPVVETGCELACGQIAARLGSAVNLPGNGNDFVVWDQKQQEVQSACRVEPYTSEDVAFIMQTVVKNSCRFAVKCGGHTRNADDSVSVGGVTIDLVRMKSVEIAPDQRSVRLGAGHILHSLYTGLEQYNLSTTGGRVADVGLGGFALGGGLSNFSPKYGLAVDNVFAYEVVLANSTVVNITEKTQPDLYFALRGGMNNFGIVTHFTMRAFPQGQMFAGSRSFAIDQREAVVSEAHKLTTEWASDTNMSFSYGFAYRQASDDYAFSFTEAYSEPMENPVPFQALNSLPYTSSTLRVDWMSNFALEGAKGRPPGSRNVYATISYTPSAELDRAIQDIAVEEMQDVKQLPGFSPNVIFQPLHENAIRAGKDRGGNALGIESDGPLTLVLLTVGWSNSTNDQAVYDFAARFIQRAKELTVEAELDNRWMYINYANQVQDPFAGYGAENKKRLQEVQEAVDPNGVFTSTGLCRGYFKVR